MNLRAVRSVAPRVLFANGAPCLHGVSREIGTYLPRYCMYKGLVSESVQPRRWDDRNMKGRGKRELGHVLATRGTVHVTGSSGIARDSRLSAALR